MIRVPRFRPSREGKKLASHLVLRELGVELGVGPIELDADGGTQLTFGQDLVVDLEQLPGSDVLYLSAPVGQLDSGLLTEARAELLAELLAANLLGRDTGGATLALDTLLDEVVLCRGLPSDGLTLGALRQALEDFLDHLSAWRQRLAEGAAGAPAARAVVFG
jgi:hypothetical protein